VLDIYEELEDIIKQYKAIPEIFDKPDYHREIDKILKSVIADKNILILDLLIDLEKDMEDI